MSASPSVFMIYRMRRNIHRKDAERLEAPVQRHYLLSLLRVLPAMAVGCPAFRKRLGIIFPKIHRRIGPPGAKPRQIEIGMKIEDPLENQIGFWKRVLTSTERSELYNSGNGLAYENFAPPATGSLLWTPRHFNHLIVR